MLLREFFDRVYVPRRLRGKSENSVRLYRLCILQFERTLGRKPHVSDLTEENIIAHLIRRKNVSAATRNKELAELQAMWRLATQRGYHEGWPDFQDEPEPVREPVAWLPGEARQLLGAAARIKREICGLPGHLWMTGFIRLMMIDTGERVAAIRHTQWAWLQPPWLRVPAEFRKGRKRDKTYKITPETLSVLSSIRDERADETYVFPWTYTENYLWRLYKRVLEDAGLPQSRWHQLHCLRRTFGSAVHQAGMDAREALDHSDLRTTQRYLDPRIHREKNPSDVLREYLQNPNRPQDPPKSDTA